jgi:hypothetical protein
MQVWDAGPALGTIDCPRLLRRFELHPAMLANNGFALVSLLLNSMASKV